MTPVGHTINSEPVPTYLTDAVFGYFDGFRFDELETLDDVSLVRAPDLMTLYSTASPTWTRLTCKVVGVRRRVAGRQA